MPRRASIMSGTSKAIISICVLLLASLVVYYGMTPPQSSVAQEPDATRPAMVGGDAFEKLVQLGFPPIAADLAQEETLEESIVVVEIEPRVTATEEIVAETIVVEVEQPEVIEIKPVVTRMYTVLEGETLGEIASRELGSFKMWREIATLNNISNPSIIMPGRTLRMPQQINTESKQMPVTLSLELDGTTTHCVLEGETMSSIAGDYYNDVNKYYRIVQANASVDPTRLRIGTVLVIPDK